MMVLFINAACTSCPTTVGHLRVTVIGQVARKSSPRSYVARNQSYVARHFLSSRPKFCHAQQHRNSACFDLSNP